MNMSPKYIIGIPTMHKHDTLLFPLLESLGRQTARPYEVCIIDNSNTLSIDRGRYLFPVKVVKPPYNLGVSASFNLIAALYRPLDIILSNDDIVLAGDDVVEQMLGHYEHLVYGCGLAFGLIREQAWREVGLFDEAIWPASCEDNDWCMRSDMAYTRRVHLEQLNLAVNGCGATTALFPGTFAQRNLAYVREKWGIKNDGWWVRFKQPWNGRSVDPLEWDFNYRATIRPELYDFRRNAVGMNMVTCETPDIDINVALLAAKPDTLIVPAKYRTLESDFLIHMRGPTTVVLQ